MTAVSEPFATCPDCDMTMIAQSSHPACTTDWVQSNSTQGYLIWYCEMCGYWGVRYQWDAGTGADDRWHKFGLVDPATIKRHY